MATQVTALNNAIDGISAQITGFQTDVQTVIADLQAAEAADQPVDLSGPIAKLATISSALGTLDASLKSATTSVDPSASGSASGAE